MPAATVTRPTGTSRGHQHTTRKSAAELVTVHDVRALLRTLPSVAAPERLREQLLAIPGDAPRTDRNTRATPG
jgi:hypothetical protein